MTPDSRHVHAVSPSPNHNDRRGRAIDALILHYTGMSTGAAARARLLDPASQVSCHYIVWEDGRIEQLVAEAERAWHAGRSFWAGETDMNAVSIGVEIVNAGHDGGCPPYPEAQMTAVTALARDICARRAIAPARVLAHSDVAPDRKRDPGEYFPWRRLAVAGVGLWLEAGAPDGAAPLALGATGAAVLALQQRLGAIGYGCPSNGVFDRRTADVVTAFQRHYHPARVDGVADASTCATLAALWDLRP